MNSASDSGTRHHTVLVVDDNATSRYSLSRVLRAAGFATVETAGGAEALEMAAKEGVAAIVLDVHLPDLHGFEVCRLLRSQPATSTLPVIHVSAVHVQPDDHATGLRTGADAYLVSPVEPQVLVSTVEALIRSRAFEADVRHSEMRFRGVFENVAAAIALVDAESRFVEANEAFAALVGQPRQQLEGRRVATLAPARWTLQVEQAVTKWSQSWQGEFPLRAADGTHVQISWCVTPHVEEGYAVAYARPAHAS
ncbi:response regulator [Ramlibacter sp. G-1-2-2]|uniref:Response regulator n=1 Tax=Ramlibacter agri TaxID=2728837 RepID=A0A848H5B5_9BURK|nr:response regulator [Ramlibacter agri]NML45002.1 response regulator [Ramlibacter agri]